MSGDERKLIAKLGPVEAAVEAVNLALVSNGSGESDLSRLEAGDESYVLSVVAALANLAAILARTVVHAQGRAAGATSDGAKALLETIHEDQEVRAARETLDDLDGFPFQ